MAEDAPPGNHPERLFAPGAEADDLPALGVLCGQPLCAAGVAGRQSVLLRVRAQRAPQELTRAPLCIVLCLDVSGSMAGEPLREVQHAVTRLTQLLGPEDALGLVAFHSEARALGPLRRLADDGALAALHRDVAGLTAEGRTNIDGALAKAALLLPPTPAPLSPGAAPPRLAVVLLSDGIPNVGAVRPAELSAATALIHRRGVNVSVLGFGAEHNEDILLAIAQAGGGRYAYVKDPQAADAAFARALGGLMDLAARDVCLTLRPSPGVSIQRVLGNPRQSFSDGGLTLSLPDLLYGETLDVVVDVALTPPRDPGLWRVLRATLAAQLAAPTGATPFTTTHEVAVQLVDAGALPPQRVDARVDRAEAQAQAAMQRDEARARADRRDYDGAAALLRQALLRIERVPDFQRGEATPLGDAFEALSDDIVLFEAKAPDRDQKYRDYRKVQLDGQSIHGSLLGGMSTGMTPSVRRLTNQVAAGAGGEGRLVLVQGNARAPRGQPPRRDFAVAGEVRLGRGNFNDVILDEDRASRVHAVILPGGRDGGFLLEDMGSSNGTLVNGTHIYRGTRLKDGDLIQIGRVILRFEDAPARPLKP